jgi:hypothetical protein
MTAARNTKETANRQRQSHSPSKCNGMHTRSRGLCRRSSIRPQVRPLDQCAHCHLSVFKPSTVEEFLHIAWSELAQIALSSSSEPVALGCRILVCPSALGLVTPAGAYSVSHHVPNTMDGRRSRRLRALLAQTFLLLSQLPFALPRDR